MCHDKNAVWMIFKLYEVFNFFLKVTTATNPILLQGKLALHFIF